MGALTIKRWLRVQVSCVKWSSCGWTRTFKVRSKKWARDGKRCITRGCPRCGAPVEVSPGVR